MKREFRLTKSTDFKRVRRSGSSYAHPLMVLIAFHNPGKMSRFGVSAGKSVGNAVKRNRTKRLLRAAIREICSKIEPGWDFVLIARKPLVNATKDEAASALQALLHRAHLTSG